jgi:hypothetical protein
MPPTPPRSLAAHLLRAHRAKGVRYAPASQSDCYKTWYAYALRRGEAARAVPYGAREAGVAKGVREWVPEGGRMYM